MKYSPGLFIALFLAFLLAQGNICTGNGNIFDVLILRGDTNNDSVVDISDAIKINEYLFDGGPAPTCLDQADANDDGALDISDYIYLVDFLFNGGPTPPAPGPSSCGKDPTEDSLTCDDSHCND